MCWDPAPRPAEGTRASSPQDQSWGERPALSTRSHPAPARVLPRGSGKDIRQPPPNMWSEPRPLPHSLAQVGCQSHRGLLVEETEGQRGEAPCPGPRSPGIKELKFRL